MTIVSQTRFEWLKDYQDLHDEIEMLRFRLRKVNSEIKRWESGDLSNVRITQDSKAAHLGEDVAKIKRALHRCEAERDELLALVDSFRGDENTILRMKYIEGWTLEEIATELHRSPESIRKIHAELHRRLDFLDHFGEVQLRLEQRKDYVTDEDKNAEWNPNYYD